MQEVAEARVLIVVPQERLFSRDQRESKASVFLQLRPGAELDGAKVNAIRHLVASGVENLAPSRVSVVDSAGRALAESDSPGNLASLSSTQLAVVRALEDNLRDKAQSMLDQVLGPGEAVVRVTADMSFDTVSETVERFDPRGTVPRQETTTTESTTSRTQAPGGAAGVAANTAAPAGADSPVQSSQQTRETVTNQYEINRTVETRQRGVGTVRRVTTAVLLNQRRTTPDAGGAVQPTPRSPAELRALEDLVRAAVGFTQDAMRQDVVQLREVEFTDMFAGTADGSGSAAPGIGIERLLPYASQGFLVLLSAVVLLYFRSIVHNSKRSIESREFSELLNRYESLTAQSVATAAAASGARRHLSVDEMQRILKDNPGNSAQAIKQWLGRN
jgi:flagellar M-ring protein FliF